MKPCAVTAKPPITMCSTPRSCRYLSSGSGSSASGILERCGETVGEASERASLFEVGPPASCAVTRDLGHPRTLVARDLLGRPSPTRLRFRRRCHAPHCIAVATLSLALGHLSLSLGLVIA